MITNKGKELISRYLAGRASSWAGAIEFGVGTTAAAVTDTSLEFPFIRVPVEYADYDSNTYEITVRAVLPQTVTGEFHEVGVFSSEDFPSGEQGHQLLLDFSGIDTVYSVTNAVTTAVEARVGSLAYLLTAPPAGTATLRGYVVASGLDEYTGNDTINLAYFYNDLGGSPNVNVRFESTLTDYFSYSFAPTAGYNIHTVARENLSQTGSPTWGTINSIYIELDAEGEITLDGMMIEDTINVGSYGMIARAILSPELVKAAGVETDALFKISLGF